MNVLILIVVCCFIQFNQAMRITLQTDDGARFIVDSDLLKTSKTLQECYESIDYEKEKVVPVVGLAGGQFSELLGYWQLNDDAQRCRQSLQPQTKEKLAQLLNHSTYLGIDLLSQMTEDVLVQKLNNKDEWKLAENNEDYDKQLGLADSALNKKVAAALLGKCYYNPKKVTLVSYPHYLEWGTRMVTFASDDNFIAQTSGNESINIIDLSHNNQEKLENGQYEKTDSLTFNPENKNQLLSASRLLSANRYGSVKLWDIEKRDNIQLFKNDFGSKVADAIFMNNNIIAAIRVWAQADSNEDYELLLCDMRSPLVVKKLNNNKYMSLAIKSLIKKDDTTMLLCPYYPYEMIQEWDLRTDTGGYIYHHDGINSITYNPDYQQLMSGDNKGIVKLWDSRRNCTKNIEFKNSSIKKLKYLKDNMVMVSYSKRNYHMNKVKFLNLTTGKREAAVSTRECIYDIDCCSQEKKIAIAAEREAIIFLESTQKSDITIKGAMRLLSIKKKNNQDARQELLLKRAEGKKFLEHYETTVSKISQ